MTKTITIKVDEISAKIVADMLRYYNLYRLKEAEDKDPYLNNDYLITAVEKFLEAYDKAVK